MIRILNATEVFFSPPKLSDLTYSIYIVSARLSAAFPSLVGFWLFCTKLKKNKPGLDYMLPSSMVGIIRGCLGVPDDLVRDKARVVSEGDPNWVPTTARPQKM